MPPRSVESQHAFRGGLAAFSSFLLWGILPLYWRELERIDPADLIAQRVIWTALFMALVLVCRPGALRKCLASLGQPRLLGLNLLSGGLLILNWYVFVWAVNHGFVIETSLGYFLVPLFHVGIGAWVFGERLRAPQWMAVACAAIGVGLLLWAVGGVPWIALILAVTWSLYALMRKQTVLGADEGLFSETLLFVPLAAVCLVWLEHRGAGVLGRADLRTWILLLSMGWLTAVPLILFAYGTRRIRLTTLGLLQYVAPTGQFLTGLYAFHERFDAEKLRACLFIWAGLAFYTIDGFLAQRRGLRAPAPG